MALRKGLPTGLPFRGTLPEFRVYVRSYLKHVSVFHRCQIPCPKKSEPLSLETEENECALTIRLVLRGGATGCLQSRNGQPQRREESDVRKPMLN